MARAATDTLIPLDTWAQIVGINPLHFNGAVGGTVFPASSCDVIWAQHAWQSVDQYMCREDIARALARAESDVYNAGGVWPRARMLTKTYRIPPSGVIMINDGNPVLHVGTPTLAMLQAGAPVTLLDEDDDNFYETAKVTIDLAAAIDAENVHLYYTGKAGDPAFEIRPLDKVLLGSDTLTIKAPSYLFFDWQLWERKPSTAGITPIDADAPESYVTKVDVTHTVYSANTAKVITSCCGADNQIVDAEVSFYDYPSAQVTLALDVPCRYPRQGDTAIISFTCGPQTPDPTLDLIIAEMVLARLPDAPCACNYLVRKYQDLRRDAGFTEGRSGTFLPQRLVGSPFGSHVGEIQAWQKIVNLGYMNVYAGGAL